MNEMKLCQSCAMPLLKTSDFGTNADNSQNQEYCTYCYQQGKFTQEMTMEQMINHCVQFLDQFNEHAKEKISKEQAIQQMQEHFPQLKRWAKN